MANTETDYAFALDRYASGTERAGSAEVERIARRLRGRPADIVARAVARRCDAIRADARACARERYGWVSTAVGDYWYSLGDEVGITRYASQRAAELVAELAAAARAAMAALLAALAPPADTPPPRLAPDVAPPPILQPAHAPIGRHAPPAASHPSPSPAGGAVAA